MKLEKQLQTIIAQLSFNIRLIIYQDVPDICLQNDGMNNLLYSWITSFSIDTPALLRVSIESETSNQATLKFSLECTGKINKTSETLLKAHNNGVENNSNMSRIWLELKLLKISVTNTDEFNHYSLHDKDIAISNMGGDEELADISFQMLVEQLPYLMKKIETTFYEKDLMSLQKIVHKLHGSAVYCGTIRLKKVCTELEKEIKQDDFRKIRQLTEALHLVIKQMLKNEHSRRLSENADFCQIKA